MSDIVYQFIERGKEGPKSAFREIGAEARNTTRDVNAAIKAIESLGRVQARAGRAGGAAGAASGTTAARQAIGDDTRRAQREFKDRAGYQERLGREVAAAQQRRERETLAVASRAARERAVEDRKQAQLRARQAADERAQKDADHRREVARTASQGRSEAQYWAERRRRHHASSTDEERVARRRKQFDDERRRIRERQASEFNVGGALKGALIGGALAAGTIGLGVTGAATRDSLRLRELSNRISINSRGAGKAAVDPAALQREFEQTALANPGQKAADIAEAIQGFVTKTGRLDVARASQRTFATVASATGSDVRDVSNAAADLFQKFDITSIEDMRDALAALTFQGKEGAFELKDAAGQFARLSAAASRFGVDKGVQGVKTLGGLTQIARSATGSSEQASTAVEATLRQLIAKSGDIKKLGVNVFEKGSKSKTRDVRDVLAETIAGAKGSLPKLQQIFGEEGIRGVSPLISTFNQASNATVGTEAQKTAAGIAALREQLRKAIDAPGDWSEVQKDAAQAQQDASAKLTATWERLQSKIGDAMIPVVTTFVDALGKNPAAIEAFIGTIEILGMVFHGLILSIQDLAELIGITTKKEKAPEQVAAEKRLEAQQLQKEIDKSMGTTWAEVDALRKAGKTKEADAKVARLMAPSADEGRLMAKRTMLERQAEEADATAGRKRDMQYRIRTPEEFAKEYAALAAPGQQTGPEFAAAMAKRIRSRPFEEFSTGEESEAQTEYRKAQQGAIRGERTQLLGVTGDDQTGKAQVGLAAFAAAAAQAAEAMKKIAAQGQASPVGG